VGTYDSGGSDRNDQELIFTQIEQIEPMVMNGISAGNG
jgi:hypothetical protein